MEVPKAKTAEKRSAVPRAAINARAELVNVKAANGKAIEGSSANGWKRTPTNALELTLRVAMGAPQKAVSWNEYKQRHGMPAWRLGELVRAKMKELHPPPPKPKKGEKKPEPDAAALAAAKAAEEADEKKVREEIKTEHDAKLRTKYERELARIDSQNREFMERAAAFAMFMALRGQDVQISISPVQQGFKELFSGNGHASQPQLGPGEIDIGAEDEHEPGFDDDEDDY